MTIRREFVGGLSSRLVDYARGRNSRTTPSCALPLNWPTFGEPGKFRFGLFQSEIVTVQRHWRELLRTVRDRSENIRQKFGYFIFIFCARPIFGNELVAWKTFFITIRRYRKKLWFVAYPFPCSGASPGAFWCFRREPATFASESLFSALAPAMISIIIIYTIIH